MYNTRGRDIEQLFLLPENMKDWIPEDDFSLITIDLVSILDLSTFYAEHREDGQGAAFYHPEIMIGLIIYSYFNGARSSRQIESKCRYDVGYRIVTHNSLPDHTTISRFIKKHSSAIGNLFIPVLTLLNEAGLITNKLLALDGTKIKANASLNSNLPYAKIEDEIQKFMQTIEENDLEEDKLYGEDNSGNEVPEGLRTHVNRMRRFNAAKGRLDAEQENRVQKKEEKIAEREEEEKQSGRKKRGRKPKQPKIIPDEQSNANVVDPDSSIMKSGPGCIQGYNGQIIANQDGFILVPLLSNSPVDYGLLSPSIERLQQISKLTGISLEYVKLLADAGYWSYDNFLYMRSQDIGFLCSTCHEPDIFKILRTDRGMLDLDTISQQIGNFPVSTPTLAAVGDWCERNLLSGENVPTPASIAKGVMEVTMTPYAIKRIYSRRKAIIEPVFGWIKENRSIRKFSRRGLRHCQDEWSLICLTQNLRKVVARGGMTKLRQLILRKKQEAQKIFSLHCLSHNFRITSFQKFSLPN